jgi:hypothetical protein
MVNTALADLFVGAAYKTVFVVPAGLDCPKMPDLAIVIN